MGPAWQGIFDAIGEDGEVSKETGLQAFALAIGDLPGVERPTGESGFVKSGSMAVRWLVSYWDELTPEQRAAVISYIPDLAGIEGASSEPVVILASQNRTNQFYTELAQQYFAEIGAHLQSPVNFGLTISARVGLPQEADSGMETSVVGVNGDMVGKPAKCSILVSPSGDAESDADMRATMAHEVWHCYTGAIVGLARYWSGVDPAPWLVEGQADWVAAQLMPEAHIMEDNWPAYLEHPDKPLFTRAYDAIGFYVQLNDSGTDVWTKLVDMLKANGSHAAFTASGADADPFLDRWASELLRDPGRGDPWEIAGPTVPSGVSVIPTGIQIGNGGSIPVSVAAYTNEISRFGETPDVLSAAISGHSRVSDASGHDYLVNGSSDFCILADGCICPGSEGEPPPLPLSGADVALAVTGGTTGASGTLVGTKLDDFCTKLTGTWDGTWINDVSFGTPQATGPFTMTIVQKGGKFTGTVEVGGPTCVRSGTVDGSVDARGLEFGWVFGPYDVAFEGTVSGRRMTGTYSAISCPPYQHITVFGDWEATKRR